MTRIKELREILGFKQETVAQKLGVDRSTVAKWETGEALPRADKLPTLAKLFGCSIDDLFKEGEENDAVISRKRLRT